MRMLLDSPSPLCEPPSVGHAQPFGAAPEFCPNPSCRLHLRHSAAEHQWYVCFGGFSTRARGLIQRFRCTTCGRACSTQTFSIHYWTHSTNDLAWLLGYLSTCSGMRQCARIAGVTHRVIQNRCRRLARNALALMDCALAQLDLREDLAMDGFESFTRSQYHPNNITHLTGSRSQFIYAAVHTLFRRKGSMTDTQKRRRQLIDALWKPPRSVGSDATELLADLARLIDAACLKATGAGNGSPSIPTCPCLPAGDRFGSYPRPKTPRRVAAPPSHQLGRGTNNEQPLARCELRRSTDALLHGGVRTGDRSPGPGSQLPDGANGDPPGPTQLRHPPQDRRSGSPDPNHNPRRWTSAQTAPNGLGQVETVDLAQSRRVQDPTRPRNG